MRAQRLHRKASLVLLRRIVPIVPLHMLTSIARRICRAVRGSGGHLACATRFGACLDDVHLILMPRSQHGFILPENLRPCRLIGNGTAGVVLCCTTERGAMVAVKKIRSDTEHGLQRSLREVEFCLRL